jgi:hypothetical protein
MTSEIVRRFDRDARPVSSSTTDADKSWQARIYAKAEARQREADREAGRESLRKRIGVEQPPRTLRQRIMAKIRPPKPASFDVRAELQKAREERERKARIFHP